jgi:hypothetical protein
MVPNTTAAVSFDEVRTKMRAQATESALRILGPHRSADAAAIADLILAHWANVCAASVDLLRIGDVPLAHFGEELLKRTGTLITASTMEMSVLALEALGIAVHGSRHTTQ